MRNFLLLMFFCVTNVIFAQKTITGTFTDTISGFKNIGLYTFTNGQPKYLTYTEVKDNSFSFDASTLEKGYYRILYKNTNNGYVDFIYNNKELNFKVDSRIGNNSAEFLVSKENQLLQSYHYNITHMQGKLDSVQIALLRDPKTSKRKYKKIQKKINGAQSYFEKLAENTYALNFIKASKRNNPPVPYTSAEAYLEGLNQHFLDYVDFDNEQLFNSIFLDDKVDEYVFYLQKSNKPDQQNNLYKTSIEKVLSKINKPVVKESILSLLLKRFIYTENITLTRFVFSKYQNLSKNNQNSNTLKEVQVTLNTMIGAKSPNLKLSKKQNLYDLSGSEKYLLIFWSSTCSHCIGELPKVYQFLEKNKNLKVITIGLENIEDKQSWINQTKFYPNWQNIIALNKWESKAAMDFNIDATPSYFILDSDKNILAKPVSLQELKEEF